MEDILRKINTPNDLKQLRSGELESLAHEIRTFLIDSISETGGHLASNLGIVEITIALHLVLNSPNDKIIWDVGHQAYVHKLLTGRKNQFSTLRKLGGLSGFPKLSESCHDHFETGHSSTSISAALGMARARDILKDDYKVIAVIGDGAMTGGMAFEALNDAGHAKTNITVILNDNEMSISNNVGALAGHLASIRTSKRYLLLKHGVEDVLYKIPFIGKPFAKLVEKTKNTMKYLLVPGILFEEMGFTYIGPIDGHNVQRLKRAIAYATNTEGPTLIHAVTCKGKGLSCAEENPSTYHSITPPDLKKNTISNKKTYSSAFGAKLCEFAERGERIVSITAAMPDGTGLSSFKKKYPYLFFDVGIAEQHAVTCGAGFASQGIKPYIVLYSTFAQRAYDQILHDVCMQNLSVVIALDRSGLVGEDGETHHGVFDISFLIHMPNMTILSPKSIAEFESMLEYSLEHSGPLAIRYPKGSCAIPESLNARLEAPLSWEIVHQGKGALVIFAVGRMVEIAMQSVGKLKEIGFEPRIINARMLKPLDTTMLEGLENQTAYWLCIEDNAQIGGLGSCIAGWLTQRHSKIVYSYMGIPDTFIQHGDVESLYEMIGLDAFHLVEEVRRLINLGETKDCGKKAN